MADSRKSVALGLAAVATATVLVLWLYEPRKAGRVPSPIEPRNDEISSSAQGHEHARPDESIGPVADQRYTHQTGARLWPSRAIGSVDCRMTIGRGPSSDTAVVVVGAEQGAEFAVVDAKGVQMAEALDFTPHRQRIGRREDGTVVVGLGDLRRNSGTFRDVDSREPVRIFEDGHLVYATEKAWDFDVAPDGSSYVVHEPLAGDASRLIIRNLAAGTEDHHDMGTTLTARNAYEPAHLMSYSADGSEVILHSGESDPQGAGEYWVFSRRWTRA